MIKDLYKEKMIKKLSNTSLNENYIDVIKAIPDKFNVQGDIDKAMLIAFNYGEMVGRSCERDMLKWDNSAIFENIRTYASIHNGNLPNSLDDLAKWVNDFVSDI